MPIDAPQSDPNSAPEVNAIAPDDQIVSVNDRNRRNSGKFGPFMVAGGIAAVVLVGGLFTVQAVRSKLAGPKQTPASQVRAAPSLNVYGDQKPVPGAETTASATAVGAASAQPACPDGSYGNDLTDPRGTPVVNGAGQRLKVCPNGQVLAGAPAVPQSAQPIPLAQSSRAPVPASTQMSPGARLVKTAEGYMMLNDGHYGDAQKSLDFANPQGMLSNLQQAGTAVQPKTEGLLTATPAGSMESELIPSKTPLVQAGRISDLNMLMPKGRTIDCGMTMRIISSLAGQASCLVTQNVYSANGKVVLIERGSEAVGEYRSGVSVGQKRLFVLWTRIITPGGVVINLDSPGADELGSTGLTGKVDNHWWERVGSAFLLSTIQDTIQYEVAQEQSRAGGSTVVLSNTAQAGSSMADRVLQQTINISPTIYKNQGDRAIIYVARDLDFSSVYRLRVAR